jgi:membrane fusion protein (multidrug efflux system)
VPTNAKRQNWPVFALFLLVAACSAKAQKPAPAIPEVGYVVMAPSSVPLQIELAGRTTAYETSDVRPQISGVIKARRFQEGAMVHEGQTLYEIDPSLYRAAVAQAEANLANAEAMRVDAAAKAERFKPLADIQAVSQQDYADATAAAKQAAAQVAQMRAALDTAKINLRFTTVPAPITGRIGRSMATTGALVTSGQTTALATIERLDPIFIDIPQSSADVTALRRQLSSGGVAPASADMQLTLEDGSSYPHTGKIEFSEAIVDPNTGSVTLRARFPNPQELLLPGMFVRARFTQATLQNAILVPQQAVARNPRGDATVLVVGPDNKAVPKTVVADRTTGDKWIVTSGLAPGDRVIVEGLNRVKPGQAVRPVAAGTPARITPAGAQRGARP